MDGSDLGDLRKIDLVVRLSVAQTILHSIRLPILHGNISKVLYLTVESHFKIDAKTAIKRQSREQDI